MDKHNKRRLIAIQLCSTVLATLFIMASAGAQPFAVEAANGDGGEARVRPTPARRLDGSFGPPRRDSVPAGRTRTADDQGVFREFEKAWRNSTDGHSGRESVVLIFRAED
ncbi:MAG TPA: hypothetical protein VJZ91_07045, partial [Blastocatellia bacterium]|nr:hypothetical protein [Blastocatellia bacterium]